MLYPRGHEVRRPSMPPGQQSFEREIVGLGGTRCEYEAPRLYIDQRSDLCAGLFDQRSRARTRSMIR